MSPILSIIVPSYNMEQYLPKCLGSLVVEPDLMERLEVLVVNDGSKDRTSEIAHEFAAKWPGTFKVIDKPNGNYGSCVNAALPVATGVYVKVLDADDYVETQSFAEFLGLLNACAADADRVDLIVSDCDSVNEEGCVTGKEDFGLSETASSLNDKRPNTPRLPVHAVTYKLENLRRINYRQTEGIFYTDTEWIIKPMVTVDSLRYFPKVVTHYLVGRSGQTMEMATFLRQFQQVVDVAEGLLGEYVRSLEQATIAAKAYYRELLVDLVRTVYTYGILGYDGVQATANLSRFEEALGKIPELFELSEKFCFPSRYFPIHYVREWRRRNGNADTLRLSVFRFYARIAKMKRSFCRTLSARRR